MTSGRSWSCSLAFGWAILLVLAPGTISAQSKLVLDCGDAKNQKCAECGGDGLACCPTDCDTINKPPPKPAMGTLHATVTSPGAKLTFARVLKSDGSVQFKLKQTLASTLSSSSFSTTGVLAGPDAAIAGLVYPVAFLQMGGAALDTLGADGYTFTLASGPASKTCQDVFSAATCAGLATQLAKSIDTSLQFQSPEERAAFAIGAQAVGAPPCNTTTTIGATTSTTSATTTSTTTGQTTTTTIPCQLVLGGGAGVCGGGCPPGQTCLMNAPNGSNCSCFPDSHVCSFSNCNGGCPVQFERCQPNAQTCSCCTLTGDGCSPTSVCCSGVPCDTGTGVCPAATTSTSTTTTSAAPTTSTTTTITTTTTLTPTTTIPCQLLPNGSAGVCGGSCPPGQTCLVNAPNGSTCSCFPVMGACSSSNCSGRCPVQFERCQPNGPSCDCCTLPGDACSDASVCCSGQACAAGVCP